MYAPPVWVGLLAQNAMIAVMFEKPRRLLRGMSGCILTGHRGPLDAGWGARLARSENDRSMPRAQPRVDRRDNGPVATPEAV